MSSLIESKRQELIEALKFRLNESRINVDFRRCSLCDKYRVGGIFRVRCLGCPALYRINRVRSICNGYEDLCECYHDGDCTEDDVKSWLRKMIKNVRRWTVVDE